MSHGRERERDASDHNASTWCGMPSFSGVMQCISGHYPVFIILRCTSVNFIARSGIQKHALTVTELVTGNCSHHNFITCYLSSRFDLDSYHVISRHISCLTPGAASVSSKRNSCLISCSRETTFLRVHQTIVCRHGFWLLSDWIYHLDITRILTHYLAKTLDSRFPVSVYLNCATISAVGAFKCARGKSPTTRAIRRPTGQRLRDRFPAISATRLSTPDFPVISVFLPPCGPR